MAYQSKWAEKRDQILAFAAQVKTEHPDAWNELRIKGQKSRRFINLFSMRCIANGIPAGVNLKRGGPEESIDVIALPNPSGCGDSTGTYAGLELIDIVAGAEGSDENPPTEPRLTWNDVTQKTIDGGAKGGWKEGSLDPHTPNPPAPTFPTYEDLGGDSFYRAMVGVPLAADYAVAGQTLNDGSAVWFSRTIYRVIAAFIKANGHPIDAVGEVKVVRNEWRAILGLPPL